MMANPITPEMLAKLPVWAQKHISELTRERKVAVQALNKYCDDQTPGPISIQEMECTGEEQGPSFKTRYIQARRATFKWLGIELDVLLREDNINLSWVGLNLSTHVAMVPISFQNIHLIPKEKMR